MILKVEDWTDGLGEASFYECIQVSPSIVPLGDGESAGLTLEAPGGNWMAVPLLPSHTYYLLNDTGKTVDTIRVRNRGAGEDRPEGHLSRIEGEDGRYVDVIRRVRPSGAVATLIETGPLAGPVELRSDREATELAGALLRAIGCA